jgi:hypothetical protein
MTDWFDNYAMESILSELTINWKPDQVSFKKLFGADSVASKNYDDFIKQFKSCAEYKRLELLSLGVWKYDVHGIGVVWNDDCMVSNEHETPRYLILQPDGRLYTRWDSKASAIF